MASLGPTACGSAQLTRGRPQAVCLASGSISSLRVRPFTCHKSSHRQQLTKLRAAEPEAGAVSVGPQDTEADDFQFSFTSAKKNNEYSSSDVEAALKYYLEGEGQQPVFDQDHIINQTGTEDASFFDDIDNVDGYGDDEYATAGIAEAAPKQRRRNKGDFDERTDDGDEIEKAKDAGASQQLEEEAIMRAQLEEMEADSAQDKDLDDGALEGGETAVWSWLADYENVSDVPTDDLSMTSISHMASLPTESEVLGGLAKGVAGSDELDPDTREYLEFLAEDMALEQELALADESAQLEIPESAVDDADDEARIAELLATPLPELELNEKLFEDDEALEDIFLKMAAEESFDNGEFMAYLDELRAVTEPAAEEPAEEEPAEGEAPPPTMEEVMALLDSAGAVQEELKDDGMDEEQAAVEALLQYAPVAPAEEDDADFLALFAEPDQEDNSAEDDDEAKAYERDLAALMADDAELEEDTLITEEQLEMYSAYVNAGEAYLAGEEQRREELSAAVARGELPVDVLEEELADPVDNEAELYDDIISRAEDDTAGDYVIDDSAEENMDWQERILELTRVTKVTKGGKMMGFRCTAVVGNGAGLVGVGCDSGREIAIAVKRALVDAKKHLIRVPLVGPGTVPHLTEAKFKSARCLVRPASDGTGVIAGGSIRSVLELAGVQNCLAKRLGCRSLLNNARATIKALSTLKTLGEVAEARGVPYEELLLPSKR